MSRMYEILGRVEGRAGWESKVTAANQAMSDGGNPLKILNELGVLLPIKLAYSQLWLKLGWNRHVCILIG